MRTVVALLITLSLVVGVTAGENPQAVNLPVQTYKAIAYTKAGSFFMSAHFDNPIDAERSAVAGCVSEYRTHCINGVSATQESQILLLSCPSITGPVSGSLSRDRSAFKLDPRASLVSKDLQGQKCEVLWRL